MLILKRISVGLLCLGVVATLGWMGFFWWNSLPLAEAQRAFRAGEYAIAAELAEARLNQGHPDDQKAMRLAARSYANLARWAEAEAYFARVPLSDTQDYRLRARGLESRRLWTEAALVYDQILQRWRDD